MTAEQEQECYEHLDAILELTGGVKLSTLMNGMKQQMRLSAEEEELVFGVIQKTINDSIILSFTQAGDQIKQMFDNPVMQAEMREKMEAMRTPKGETKVEVPTECD
jgi:hypothetical protein